MTTGGNGAGAALDPSAAAAYHTSGAAEWRSAMFLSESTFDARFGAEFERRYRQCRDYAAEPDRLRRELAANPPPPRTVAIAGRALRTPAADAFAYQIVLARRFAGRPQCLRNFLVAERAERTPTVEHLPIRLDIEPNARCNSRCVMCQVSTWPKMTRTRRDLSLDELARLLQEQIGLTEIKLHGMGEPLLNPSFFEMVELIRSQDLWVRTNSNGTLLHLNDGCRRLIDCGINEVQMSFDGATKEVFEAIRVGSSFERVVDNMTAANAYANARGILVTRMWSVIQQDNRHQLAGLYEMGKRMGFRRITFSIGLGDWGQETMRDKNQPRQAVEQVDGDELERLAEQAAADGIDLTFWCLRAQYVAGNPASICPWPFVWGYISTDLRTVPCCMIANPDIVELGDAMGFAATWNGPAYQAFRQAHLDGRIPDPCRNCYVPADAQS